MTHADYRRENALLLAAAGDATPPTAHCPLDWSYLLAAANRQGVLPLLHRWREVHGVPAPPEAIAALHAAHWDNHFRTRTLLAELATVRAAAAAVSIPLLPLKGAALAPTVYATPDLRPMSDLDLLTRAGDLEAIGPVLASLGYLEKQEPAEPSLLPPRLRDPLRRERQFTAARSGFTVLIEVRAEPLDPGLTTLTELDSALSARLHTHAAHLWERAAIGDDLTTARAAPEDLLLHVASHMTTRHVDFRLIWLCDLREIIAHAPGFDWEVLAHNACALGLMAPVRTALDAAARWLDAPLPPAARIALTPRGWHPVDALERRALTMRSQGIATADLRATPPTPPWRALAATARVSWRARAAAVRWLALPTRDYLAGWRNTPGAALTGAAWGRTVAFRLYTVALLALAAVARRLHVPLLPARIDRLMRRVNPFGQYVER